MAAHPAVRFITRKWPPAVGGMETYSLRLAGELEARTPLQLLALPGRRSGEGPRAWRIAAFGAASALRLIASRPAPVVHVGDAAAWPLGWIAGLRGKGSAVIVAAHGSDISYAARPTLRGRLYKAYLRLGARLMRRHLLVANSAWIAAAAQAHGFRRTAVVPLGADFGAAQPPRAHNGCILFAGRIARGKGLSRFIEEVLPQLPQSVRLRVAGPIWEADEAASLGCGRVDYLGMLGPEALAREYAAAMCVVVPSIRPEGFGLVAVEAAGAGGVVIAARHSGLAEAVREGAGFLVEPDHAAAWARTIREVMGWSEAERTRFVAGAMAQTRAFFTWRRVADDMLRLYSEEAGA